MQCECGGSGGTYDTRQTTEGTRRRYKCRSCGLKWTTWETKEKPGARAENALPGRWVNLGRSLVFVPVAAAEEIEGLRNAVPGKLQKA
jgi:hypothetical protein